MEQKDEAAIIKKDELIYWIDKELIQEVAKERIGRELTDAELDSFKEYIDWGLCEAVYDTINVSIDLAVEGF